MHRNITIIIVNLLILSGCTGGLSGIVSSAFPGHWLVYKVSYPEDGGGPDQSIEDYLDNQLFSHGFKKKYDWRRPWFSNVRVATFNQIYRGNYIIIDTEISQDLIIIMSTSYSEETEKVFNRLESSLKETFGESSVEVCFGTKDIYWHRCFNTW